MPWERKWLDRKPAYLAAGILPTACTLFVFCQGLTASELESRILSLIEAHAGQVSVAVKHLENGEHFDYRADRPMPTASLVKFPVMVEAYRQAQDGKIDPGKMLTVRAEDKVPGSGVLTPHFSEGASLSLRDAIRLMIAFSDNTATNLVLDEIGIGSVAESMEDLGLPNTKIHAKVYRRDTSIFPERSREFGLGSTTAAETILLYEKLFRGQLVSEAASREMLEHLTHCEDESKLARFLPSGTKIAHKGGAVSQVRCDAGIVFSPAGPIAICVMTSENQDRRWIDDNAGNRLCAEIARRTFEYFNPHQGAAVESAGGTLQLGAHGRLVEDLQRTLNARLDPSPELSVDGDFGPMTQAAVIRFQKAHGIEAGGEVAAVTWEALGTLITREPTVRDPAVVNGEQLAKEPAEDLAGPPLLTCKAWAVADGSSGEILFSSNEDRSSDIASTTKIMTAFVVLSLAESDAKVLDEEVVFSARADGTIGSTAGVRAGERVRVGELLFGLLLPSGNDASVALAEHFGDRFSPPEREEDADALRRFVAQMNRTAKSLGMDNTTYRNPHGLTAPGHRSTVKDLVTLTHAALQLESFRNYVSTRQYGYTLLGAGGYKRNVVWKNTNQLLGREGYLGVKTGTTSAAGACLVSVSQRDDDRLIVVVLGSVASRARYIDTRNLFRWAWRQRGQRE